MLLDRRVLLVTMVQLVLMEHKALPEMMALMVQLDQLEHKALLEMKVPPVQLDHKALPGMMV